MLTYVLINQNNKTFHVIFCFICAHGLHNVKYVFQSEINNIAAEKTIAQCWNIYA